MNNLAENLQKQMRFLMEIEKLKMIYRQNVTIDGSRQENSAEHSWHIAMMAMVLLPQSDKANLDLLKIMKMLLIHDIVEIDFGDTFLYDAKANESKASNENKSAERIFGLLPDEQGHEMMALWQEFEKRTSPEAKFAAALDGMQPIVNHYLSNGVGIRKHHLKTQQIIDKKKYIGEASQALWDFSLDIIHKSEEMGLYSKE